MKTSQITKGFWAIFALTVATLLVAGCIGNGELDDGLGITVLEHAEEIRGLEDYDVRDNNVYPQGEDVLIYMEAEGFEVRDDIIEIKQDIVVTHLDTGDVILDDTLLEDEIDVEGMPPEMITVWLDNDIYPENEVFETGDYEVEITVYDVVGDQSTTEEASFTVEDPNGEEDGLLKSTYIEACVGEDEEFREYCECTYDFLIDEYGEEVFEQIVANEIDPEEEGEMMDEAATACLDKIPEESL